MSPDDRLRLIGEIWDSLPESDPTEISQAHREEIDRRLAAAESNPDAAVPWEEVRARLRGKQ
jgi:putative addiction module component (TIGR02574 family)